MIELLFYLEQQKQLLQKQLSAGIIDIVGATEESGMIEKKERSIKKQLVDKVHITGTGELRSITHHDATPSYPRGYVYTKLKGGKLVKSKDIESLYDKLFEIYYGCYDKRYCIGEVFKSALKEKEDTENPKQNTIYKYLADYKRFVNEDLAVKDIRDITEHDIKAYTQQLVKQKSLNKKAYLAYKGTLNLIFGYAMNHEIIDKNPVDKIKNSIYLKSCDCSKAKPQDKILSEEDINLLIDEVKRRMTMVKYGDYYVNGYAMRFAILTGVRVAELCALMWEDIDFESNLIHIHAQQLTRKKNGHVEYYYAPYTKNEKGISEDGRYYPLVEPLKELLLELKEKQNKLGISPRFVFSYEDGKVIKTIGYETFLRRLCRSVGLSVTNNHAFRMSLNSNVFIQNGISVADRAMLLGHSVETNLKHYSFAQKDCVDNARELLNNVFGNDKVPCEPAREPLVIKFGKKKNALKPVSLGHF